uniref:Uncharacterized protein n=1 Tax=Amphimedon queenslandica TaxID=400682 RepID=A0A1X7TZT8_AMPQE
MCSDGLIALELGGETNNGEKFCNVLPGVLIPEMSQFDGSSSKLVLIMDNCKDVRQCIKDLAIFYKSRNSAEVKGGPKMGNDLRKITTILGGMLYNFRSGKGIKRHYLPKPNPQMVEIPKNCTFKEFVRKAKTLYFGKDANESKMNLADSSGILIQVDKATWNLDQYYKDNNYQPSRHKMYVLYHNEPVRERRVLIS